MKIEKATDTGDVWVCPICHKEYHLIHRGLYENQKEVKKLKHDFEEMYQDGQLSLDTNS